MRNVYFGPHTTPPQPRLKRINERTNVMPAHSSASPDLTQLLLDWSNGDESASDKLFPLVYDELKRTARRYMRKEKPGHTLQTAALVNEAYLRLIEQQRVHWQNRAQFYAIAAQMMRRILVDHARRHARLRRGAGAIKISLDEVAVVSDEGGAELIALDDALQTLAKVDARRSQVVELRFFGGLSNSEIGEVLKITPNTVMRDWNLARAWLYREMRK